METTKREERVYPTGCTSAFCGNLGPCPAGCVRLPELLEFKAWRERTGAVQADPIWSPTIYRAPAPACAAGGAP